MAVQVERWQFTVDEFHRLVETGFLKEDDRVELIHGELIRMNPIGPGHGGQVNRLNRMLGQQVTGRALVSVQNPVRLGDWGEPQPDCTLLRPRLDDYSRSNPVASDVMLLIEVSDTTLEYDRLVKGPMYAEAGIAEYWIVNIAGQQLLVHRDPTASGYGSVQALTRDDTVTPLAFPDLAIAVADILI